jgi:hypothetical protein
MQQMRLQPEVSRHPRLLPMAVACLAACLTAWLSLPLPVAAADAADPPAGNEAEATGAEVIQALAADFFEWRRMQQPSSGDDIPRVERPDGWVPDYSPEALAAYREQYREYILAVDRLDTSDWAVASQVDARLLRAAVQRVFWELEVLESPHRDPLFYVHQSLGSVFELLLISSPIDEARARNIVLRLERFPHTLKAAQSNLDRPVRPFAQAAIERLEGIGGRLRRMERALAESFPEALRPRLAAAVTTATAALDAYSAWLQSRLDSMQTAFALGPPAYQWFLTNVALLPYTPGELLAHGGQAWQPRRRLGHARTPPQPRTAAAAAVRVGCAAGAGVVPQGTGNPRLPRGPRPADGAGLADALPQPPAAGAVGAAGLHGGDRRSDLGDAAGRGRLQLHPRALARPALLRAVGGARPAAADHSRGRAGPLLPAGPVLGQPRPDPASLHRLQRQRGHRLLRRGTAAAGRLFDFSPQSREIVYNFMRLRALRVEIDIRLAVGDFTIEQAADYLARAVPMDRETALEEAVFFAANPGQAISYQAGKLQILRFLADARLDRGEDFSLRDFHDYLMRNGNVPIALQRWEYLGRDDDLRRLDALGGMPVTVPR